MMDFLRLVIIISSIFRLRFISLSINPSSVIPPSQALPLILRIEQLLKLLKLFSSLSPDRRTRYAGVHVLCLMGGRMATEAGGGWERTSRLLH